ncbi:S-adenosyl-L-methionine-dependent methyltransferase [Epithele typhae]|uniref:S-adenosyl-L-methionine-dependent methyltransferase n=1 Tax=Epithele typhae TaxID=378194 RepID=UPI00200770BB|nr:S-adenosyl-L-methionine-dependent methyltransferase [Epithele typhae]KAH9927408.1 S-adenosyl-L-methionine-dependent methyltransferase [Epithele typhae]
MASLHPRPRSSSPTSAPPAPPEKKARLDAEPSASALLATNATSASSLLASTPSDATQSSKDPKKGPPKNKKNKKRAHVAPEPFSAEDILNREVVALLGQEYADAANAQEADWDAPFEQSTELELTVACISPSSGQALSVASVNDRKWVIVTPLSLPGERIRVKISRHSRLHSHAKLLETVESNSEWRDTSRVQCRYLANVQVMLSYERQLELKRETVSDAYKYYSNIPPESVPPIQPTIGSPLQYGYRTKLTPHFHRPPMAFQKAVKRGEPVEGKPDWLKIGFNELGSRNVLDIEECPIATPIVSKTIGPVKENIVKNIHKYTNGATLLLRDSLPLSADNESSSNCTEDDEHICVTDHKTTVRERVGDMFFEYNANTFFQNNNSALVPLTSYVQDAIFPADSESRQRFPRPTHLVDAYCGSGLFSIMLARHFDKVAGIELSAESIRAAQHNAELNRLPAEKISFIAGDAANIFDTVQDFPREHTVLIIDPPRKGTDQRFIQQMLAFSAQTVVYVSCNVHTQARDVGSILEAGSKMVQEGVGRKYVLQSLCGLDLFPQTAHVESIVVLSLE